LSPFGMWCNLTPVFLHWFSVWMICPLLKWGVEVISCYCIGVFVSLLMY
jgi:hypothetical protein